MSIVAVTPDALPRELLVRFADRAEAFAALLRRATRGLAEGAEWGALAAELEAEAHKISGLAGSFGAEELGRFAAALEADLGKLSADARRPGPAFGRGLLALARIADDTCADMRAPA